ncbi:MAG: hypothetical protein Kow00117_07550 [Phototrophicales bacterium]
MRLLKLFIGMMTLIIIALPRPTQAVTLDSVTITTVSIGTQCSDYQLQIDIQFTGVVNDGSGYDLIGMVVIDASGVAVAADWQGWLVGSSYNETFSWGPGNIINNFTTRPLYIKFFDITTNPPMGHNTQAIFDNIVGQNAPLLQVIQHDPADHSSYCNSLPLIQPPALPLGLDGRINPDAAAPFVVYAVDGGMHIYYPQGSMRLLVTADEIAAAGCPESGAALIDEGNGVSVYRLSDCSFQLNAPSLGGEKTYVLKFSSLSGGGYQSFEQ